MTAAAPAPARFPAWLLAPFVAGSLLALAGGYWDDAWHTERGRDDFLIAPHLAIYGGVALVGGALALWIAIAVRRSGEAAQALSSRPLRLALLSVSVTFLSAPIDNVWHVAFGRDAVIWSPPHVLGIVGSAMLATTMLVQLRQIDRPWAGPLRAVAGAAVVAPFAFLVIEYDNDVPQFATLWYLPALAFGSAVGFGIVRLATPSRLPAFSAAAVHLSFVLAVSLFLALKGFDVPLVPLLVVPALVLDLTCRRQIPLAGVALAYAVTLFAVYVPVVNWIGDGVFIDVTDVALGVPLAWAGALAALRLTLGGPVAAPAMSRVALAASVVALLAPLALAPAALAHDPGQGERFGAIDLNVAVDGERAQVQAKLVSRDRCDSVLPSALVARRAGTTRRAPLARSGCEYRGAIALPERGRWFVYVELRSGGGDRSRLIESWLPVDAEDGARASERGRFAYVAERSDASLVKLGGGIAIYAAMLALLVAVVRFVRGSVPRAV